MGTHSWFYKKITALTDSEKKYFIDKAKQDLTYRLNNKQKTPFSEYWERMEPCYRRLFSEYLEDLKNGTYDECPESDVEELKKTMSETEKELNVDGYAEKKYNSEIDEIKNLLNSLDKNVNTAFVVSLKYIKEHTCAIYKKYNGVEYLLISSDAPFRMYDDTIEKFFDADSLINFIKENNSQVVVYENSQTRFVYDEEIEKLVNDCFNENGNGNLLIEFG